MPGLGTFKRSWIIPGALLLLLVIYPFFPVLDVLFREAFGLELGTSGQLLSIFIFAILALALNLQVGYAGLLQLGIAAFFAIGAYTTGILTVSQNPFQLGFWGALIIAPIVAGIAGLVLAAPTIRLKGDYLAIVTLGFGEVTRVVLLNTDAITEGPRSLNPIPQPWMPSWITGASEDTAKTEYVIMYFIALLALVGVIIAFRLLERSRAGRELVALREDELATACMGINPAKTKLTAFAIGAAIAGLAGVLYATKLKTTASPDNYDFNQSMMPLCYVIVGGLASTRGVLLGTALIATFDTVISPLLTRGLQALVSDSTSPFLEMGNWRLAIFGVALILFMRFRPEGLWPNERVKEELHEAGNVGASP